MADFKALADISQTNTDFQSGDLFFLERAGAADKRTFAQLQTATLTPNVVSLSGLTLAADRGLYSTGASTLALFTLTAAGRALLDDADAAAQRTTLGLGTAATLNAGTSANNLVQLDGSARLPAVDGSQLTNLPTPTSAITLGTEQATTSGTEVDFTGIPATAKAIHIMFNNVSLDLGGDILVQIGDSGGFETTGYNSYSAYIDGTTVNSGGASNGFNIDRSDGVARYSGIMTLRLQNAASNTWVASHSGGAITGDNASFGGGAKSLSGTLTQVRVMVASGNFDLGAINIQYEV